MILDLTTFPAVRRERLRLALELNRSYYGNAIGIRSVNRGYYNQEQQHWTFEFIGNDGKIYTYGIFKFELERDVAKVEIPEVTPESLIETIETEVRKYDATIFCLRDKKRSHVVTFTTLVRGIRLDWKFVQYPDELIFASHTVDGFYINIDKRVNNINSVMRVVNKMLSDITIAEGMRAYA